MTTVLKCDYNEYELNYLKKIIEKMFKVNGKSPPVKMEIEQDRNTLKIKLFNEFGRIIKDIGHPFNTRIKGNLGYYDKNSGMCIVPLNKGRGGKNDGTFIVFKQYSGLTPIRDLFHKVEHNYKGE